VKPVERHRSFEKAFKKRVGRDKKLRAQFIERLSLFQSGVRNQPIDDHALSGQFAGKRAFSITADVRVIYEEFEDKIIFLYIGSHSQVY
jgi:addiction module RelE/StbE family toxin